MIRTRKPAPRQAADIATAQDAELFCGRFYKTVETLRELIETETRALKEMNIAQAELLQDKKNTLAGQYMQELSQFKAQAASIVALAPERVAALRAHHEALRKSILDNEETLLSLKSVSTSLIRQTAERVAEATGGPRTYARDSRATSAPKAAAVAYDRRA